MIKFLEFDVATMIRLFHIAVSNESTKKVNATRSIQHGLLFVDDACNVLDTVDEHLFNLAIDTLGLDNEIWSNTFHKSWDKVENTPIEQLVFEQLVHYFSTYGLEYLGLPAMPVIPCEDIISDKEALPNIKAFTVIRVVSTEEALKIIEEYLRNVKSPHKNEIDALMSLMHKTSLAVDDLISFELKVIRCDQLGIVPVDGQDFLRYAVYKMTGSTLLIKNTSMISSIQKYCAHSPDVAYRMLSLCNEVELAKIFFRFKPIILAFKKSDKCRPIVNRIRRLANKYHRSLSDKNVANLTKLISEDRCRDAIDVIDNADNRTLIKLINFTSSEMLNDSNIKIFNIRNGSSYVTERETEYQTVDVLNSLCFSKLMHNCKNKLEGKTYLIPKYIEYTVPVSEKQMIGQLPYGTVVHGSDSDTITPAIWWTDQDDDRTDIDIHLNSKNRSFGWNSNYRYAGENAKVLYSGDMTYADPYASEAFRITLEDDEVYILTACLYCGSNNTSFKFILTDVDFSRTDAPVNVEDALFAPIDMKFNNTSNMSIGFAKGNSFYFYGGELGKRITPDAELNNRALDAMTARVSNMLKLEEFIVFSGGRVIRDISEVEDGVEVISLEPNAITANTLFDIID